MNNQQQISIKQIPTDKLKASVYDLSKERDNINNLINGIEKEIALRSQVKDNPLNQNKPKEETKKTTEPEKPKAKNKK